MPDPIEDPTAPLSPADHMLAHALSAVLLQVVRDDPGWRDLLRDLIVTAADTPCARIHPRLAALREIGVRWASATPCSAEQATAEHFARQALVDFHKWRAGLAQTRLGATEVAA